MNTQNSYISKAFSGILYHSAQVFCLINTVCSAGRSILTVTTKVVEDAVKAIIQVHLDVLKVPVPVVRIAVGNDHVLVSRLRVL